jgi:hypothetical protein
MRRTPEIENFLRARLQEAVNVHANGSADEFGRLIGYKNGGSVRQSLQGGRRVQPAILERSKSVECLRGWFDIPQELQPPDERENTTLSSSSMFSDDLKRALLSRGDDEVLRAENMLRAMLGMPQVTHFGNEDAA